MSTKREIDEDVFHVEREVGDERVMGKFGLTRPEACGYMV